MTKTYLFSIGLLSITLLMLNRCERNKAPLSNDLGEFRVGKYIFPVATRNIDGVEVHYVIGLVNFTTNPDVTIEQLQPLIRSLNGEILEFWQPTGTRCLTYS